MANERGSIAILGLIAMMLLGVMGAGLVTLSNVDVSIAANHRDGGAAQYLAEAGAQWAIVQLKTDTNFIIKTETQKDITTYRIDNEAIALAGYTVITKFAPSTFNKNQRLITSIGTVNKATRQITVQILWITDQADSFETIWNN